MREREKGAEIMSRTAAPKSAADAPPSAAVVALFDSLADPDDPELISMEGLQSLGDKVGLDASSDVKFLVLLWKLGAGSKPGCVTRTEFYKGMRTMRKESLDALRQMIPSLDPGFLERAEFRDYYKFVFQFSREGTRKSIGSSSTASPICPLILRKNKLTPSPPLPFTPKPCREGPGRWPNANRAGQGPNSTPRLVHRVSANSAEARLARIERPVGFVPAV